MARMKKTIKVIIERVNGIYNMNQINFQPGDLIICLDNKNTNLTILKQYEVIRSENNWVQIKNDSGVEVRHSSYKFMLDMTNDTRPIDKTNVVFVNFNKKRIV